MKKPHSIHFVGIKGVGMAPLAIIAKEAGIQITGSDLAEEFITDSMLQKAGIVAFEGFRKEHVDAVDLVITTGAHGGFDNIEVKEAKRKNIPILTQGQALGQYMNGGILGRKDIQGISVTGSHGKTTTTAMIATILKVVGEDPSFVIGTSEVPSLGSAGHYGAGKFFVAEADEYATEPVYDKTPKFLWQKPLFAVFTNIELDHPDLYPTIEAITKAFMEFTNNILPQGKLIVWGDDIQIQKILQVYKRPVVTYGFSSQNTFRITHVQVSEGKTLFTISHHDTDLGDFVVGVPGEHNALNALAAIIVCLEVGIPIEKIKKSLIEFKGSKRRFEFIATLPGGALLYDDYAHHPTEIKKTLKAFKQSFPKKRIICIFQPHTYSRTKVLFNEFVHAFSDAEIVILVDIYASLREGIEQSVSSQILATEIQKIHKNTSYIPSVTEIAERIKEYDTEKSVIITMGAGDVYKVRDLLDWDNRANL